jgi:hypothetical protein
MGLAMRNPEREELAGPVAKLIGQRGGQVECQGTGIGRLVDDAADTQTMVGRSGHG